MITDRIGRLEVLLPINHNINKICNGNRTEWSTIQGVIGRVISNRFETTSPITPELYDTKSYYQLIVPITKCENLSLGTIINVRSRFQSKKNDWFVRFVVFKTSGTVSLFSLLSRLSKSIVLNKLSKPKEKMSE